MSFLGVWNIDDVLTFYVNTQAFATGVATDADSAPAYRVYEDETGTPLLTGTMALLDGTNTAGFYSEQITLSAANGFEVGKQYAIYISATVSSVAGATHRTFQVESASVAQTGDSYAIVNSGTHGNAALKTLIDTVDTVVDAVKVKTDSLAFTVAGQVDANIQYVNNVQVTGNGQAGSEWGP